ncbi:cytochrome P450 [Phaeosphaeria sp. MPI-PUGE-AT-0046c]|nr:cytochrome P450 [Phaeosphaeria sp. MPI-PUGE-AT-0046c]
MHPVLAIIIIVAVCLYALLQTILYLTQSEREPPVLESSIPFMDFALGILKHRAGYMAQLRRKHGASIHTLRVPFQRLYVVHTPSLIQTIQSKANAATFVPNLLDFGMLFSGLNSRSQAILGKSFSKRNAFTMSVHKYLLSGPSLAAVTSTALDKLSSSLPNTLTGDGKRGLMELVRHELTMALTGAIYGPENPYDDIHIEASWYEFVPGISHLLYSPFPYFTARKAMQARARIINAFRKYFETGGHLQAFPMIPEMYEANNSRGLAPSESAKMEMATSLAMLSSGANTTFWVLYHIFSNPSALQDIREELLAVSKTDCTEVRPVCRTIDLSLVKTECPTLVAILNETLRFHSSVINIKQVQHDTTLADEYLLKKNGIVMIPGQSIHHDKEIWGSRADAFDHLRFLDPQSKRNLSTTSAFRPFGAGATMCPGRHFSTNVILGLVAMVVVQYDFSPVEGQWKAPTTRNADIWNAMPKPDRDLMITISRRHDDNDADWKFVWTAKVERT